MFTSKDFLKFLESNFNLTDNWEAFLQLIQIAKENGHDIDLNAQMNLCEYNYETCQRLVNLGAKVGKKELSFINYYPTGKFINDFYFDAICDSCMNYLDEHYMQENQVPLIKLFAENGALGYWLDDDIYENFDDNARRHAIKYGYVTDEPYELDDEHAIMSMEKGGDIRIGEYIYYSSADLIEKYMLRTARLKWMIRHYSNKEKQAINILFLVMKKNKIYLPGIIHNIMNKILLGKYFKLFNFELIKCILLVFTKRFSMPRLLVIYKILPLVL